LAISLDQQTKPQRCPECDVEFTVVRGSVYEAGLPIGLYLIALHGHAPEGRLAHLAVAVLDLAGRPQAVAMTVLATSEQFGYTAVDWSESPWRHEAYLGKMLDREAALASSHWPKCLEIAGRIVRDVPEVATYLD